MFNVTDADYDRFMGRYSAQLAPRFADFAGVQPGQKVLDVGCGPGGLTAELAQRVGTSQVAAIDPEPQFIEACRTRLPGVDARIGGAETLPWNDATFDAALSQLVLTFMTDAPRAVQEMRRVVRSGGTVAACMWESGNAMQMTDAVWRAAERVDPKGSTVRPKARYQSRTEIEDLFRLLFPRPHLAPLEVEVRYPGFDDYWNSLAGAGGNLGSHVKKLDETARARLRDATRESLGSPAGPFTLSGRAWAARGTVESS